MPMTDDRLLDFLRTPLEKSVDARVRECPGTSLQAFLNSVVYQRWAIGCEEIGVARRKIAQSPTATDHPLYRALVALERYGEALEAHLTDEQRQSLRRAFNGRCKRWSDDWRRRNGYVTDEEWDALFARFGDRLKIGGAYVILTQQEAAALTSADAVPAARSAA